MIKFYMDEVETSKDTFMSSLETSTFNEICNRYDDILDDCYNSVEVQGIGTYNYSYLLKTLDNTKYRCKRSDYHSDYLYELQNEFENSSMELNIDGVEFKTVIV